MSLTSVKFTQCRFQKYIIKTLVPIHFLFSIANKIFISLSQNKSNCNYKVNKKEVLID